MQMRWCLVGNSWRPSVSLHHSPKVLVIYYKPPEYRGILANSNIHLAFLETDWEETTSLFPDFSLNTFWASHTSIRNPKLKGQNNFLTQKKGGQHWIFMKPCLRGTLTLKRVVSLTHHWERASQLSENLSQSKCLEECRQPTLTLPVPCTYTSPTPHYFHVISFSYCSATNGLKFWLHWWDVWHYRAGAKK